MEESRVAVLAEGKKDWGARGRSIRARNCGKKRGRRKLCMEKKAALRIFPRPAQR